MRRDLRQELKDLKANLLYYEDLIKSHDKHVEQAAQEIAIAREVLQNILDRRDHAPTLIKQTVQRIAHMKLELKKAPPVDPKIKQLLALKEKLRALEADLGL